jgi:hypothetical protein
MQFPIARDGIVGRFPVRLSPVLEMQAQPRYIQVEGRVVSPEHQGRHGLPEISPQLRVVERIHVGHRE